jgi:membrane protein DedA with SNARE-associated domain/rhodanese-related sulfurtransferase
MHRLVEFLVLHGYSVLFGVVLAELAGLPVPSIPVFLAMGALIGLGNYSFGTSASVALIAALISDSAWYLLGRKKGSSVLKLLCRISIEPDSCVSTTREWFRRLGGWAMVIAKFLPGLSTIAAPMAGLSRMPWWKFLALDSVGVLVWAGSYMSIGLVFSTQLEEVAALASRLGSGVAMVIGWPLALWILWKYWKRRRFIKSLIVARITPEELLKRIDEVVLIDLRAPEEVEDKLPGAIWLNRLDLEQQARDIPRDRDVVVYCSCPNEATSARAALQLKKLGITRVRPLEGGYDAWRERGYPLTPTQEMVQP